MKRHALYFTKPQQTELRTETISAPESDQVLVESIVSAISPGTEMLIYRGQAPQELAADETIGALVGGLTYPLKYGYALVGRVIETGSNVDVSWRDQLVFTFHPHESHFLANIDELMPLPEGITPEEAVFLPNMETAVNLLHDGRPLIGEDVLVFGQGIVGLLTTALLAQCPLNSLITFDKYELRQQAAIGVGANACVDPVDTSPKSLAGEGADLSFELSGVPAALDTALALTGFAGRIVIGSWYGTKRATLDLGGTFHRSRINLISSQVSTIAPELSGRWTKGRRFQTAWEMIRRVKPAQFITQRVPFEQAPEAYDLLDKRPEEAIQIIFTY